MLRKVRALGHVVSRPKEIGHGWAEKPVSMSTSRGLSLIEVLIALLVLSIGLVGLAALHLKSMQFAHSSYYSSLASSIALDLEERLWLMTAEAEGGCINAGQVQTAIDELQTLWSGDGVELDNGQPMVIPGLQINPQFVSIGTEEDSWSEVSIALSWTEGRFDDNDGAEEYYYTARVVCRLPEDEDE